MQEQQRQVPALDSIDPIGDEIARRDGWRFLYEAAEKIVEEQPKYQYSWSQLRIRANMSAKNEAEPPTDPATEFVQSIIDTLPKTTLRRRTEQFVHLLSQRLVDAGYSYEDLEPRR